MSDAIRDALTHLLEVGEGALELFDLVPTDERRTLQQAGPTPCKFGLDPTRGAAQIEQWHLGHLGQSGSLCRVHGVL